MFFSSKQIVYSCALGAFLFSCAAFAAQGPAIVKEAPEQCAKGGKTLSTVKTKDECFKQGGVWEKTGTAKTTIKSLDKKDKTTMPVDPIEKSKALPPDPYENSTAIPPAGHIAPSGGK